MEKVVKFFAKILLLTGIGLSVLITTGFITLVIIFCFSIFEAGKVYSIDDPFAFLDKKIEITTKSCLIIENVDNHFIGEGITGITLDCSKEKDSILNQIENWKKLPLSDTLHLKLYGGIGKVRGREVNYLLDEDSIYAVPVVNNGYYYFVDKQNEENKHDDSKLFERYSYNYYIAIYDLDTNKLYYYENDT